MKNKLSAKEELFCTYYLLDRNGREAAAKSGYRSPQKSAPRLLRKKEVASFIKAADEKTKRKQQAVITGWRSAALQTRSSCFSAMSLPRTSLKKRTFFPSRRLKGRKEAASRLNSLTDSRLLKSLRRFAFRTRTPR